MKFTFMKLLKNKKGFDYFDNWAEFFFLILLFIGLLIGLSSPSAVVTYLVSFFSGMAAGRLLYDRKNKGHAPYILIIIGFVFGYVLGVLYGDRRITLVLFIFGTWLSYYLFSKKIISDKFI